MTARYQSLLDSPIGTVRILAGDDAITHIDFIDTGDAPARAENTLTRLARQQLSDYFAGQRRTFDLPLAAAGTDFQQACWKALLTIPYGETRSYAEQAELIQRLKAVRAVGAANGANPIAIVVPCHRVIGKNGKLTGYAGGVERKAWLLALERRCAAAL
ncbi:methylated-DNA--[protein]-cysteine S-methyltransferase [Marinimicrobium sp. C6131]|uniref:methylated-DNA--[protein]-cysteine S-methyltransferase n=1 Tax=Marinimicrobium sp. C6131 TaxID=3022676 RepID=UPI00223DB052|nr:methylated-DNA--[protein]-cysteine S-methyltransferase [Marinimicrobium sp. C6131]UZJ44013.1 methylated-DNA--[protein]-cysteine S-methyltransferase [Marinimicrobium sp. C6131]